MNKRLPANEVTKPPVKMKLLQISTQELKTIRVAIKRKDVPPDAVSGPLIRSLGDPDDLVVHKPGQKPIFDRDDINVNLDFEERIVVTTSESPKRRSLSKSTERQTTSTRDRRSRSNSRKRSPDRKYYSRSRSRSTTRDGHRGGNFLKEHSRNRSKPNFDRDSNEYGNRRVKSDHYTSKPETSSSQKINRRSSSKEKRRSFSRDREQSTAYQKSPPRSDSYRGSHYDADRRSRRTPSPYKSDYRNRKYSRSPTYKREAAYRDHTHYRKSQERRSRSPYRDRDSKYRDYRKRSRSPYSRERYKSPGRKERREYSRSPPKYGGAPEVQRRHNQLPYHVPTHFGAPWPVYEPMSPYVRFIIPEGYVPAPPPRFPGNIPIRPRLPPRQLPVYNNRLIPKMKDFNSNSSTTNTTASATITSSSLPMVFNKDISSDKISESASKSENSTAIDILNTSMESSDSLPVVTTTQEIVKITD